MLKKNLDSECSLQDAMKFMQHYKVPFPTLHWQYVVTLTLGISTATCENSFSCLTRILKAHRRSMTHERKSNLVLFAFEKSLTKDIDMDIFLKKFAS